MAQAQKPKERQIRINNNLQATNQETKKKNSSETKKPLPVTVSHGFCTAFVPLEEVLGLFILMGEGNMKGTIADRYAP